MCKTRESWASRGCLEYASPARRIVSYAANPAAAWEPCILAAYQNKNTNHEFCHYHKLQRERNCSFLIFEIPNKRNMLGNTKIVIIILHISFFENLMWKKSFMSCKQFADKSIQWVVICQLFFFVCVSCAWREKSLQKLIFCINQNALSLAFLFHFTFTAHSHCFQPQILYF